MFDSYPEESSWVLRNKCDESETTSRPYVAGEMDYNEEFCVGLGEYEFTLRDSYGDGMCCTYGDGAYEVTYKGESVASSKKFLEEVSFKFGSCPLPATDAPTDAPTEGPSDAPTERPSDASTDAPTEGPSDAPTERPGSIHRNVYCGKPGGNRCGGAVQETVDQTARHFVSCCTENQNLGSPWKSSCKNKSKHPILANVALRPNGKCYKKKTFQQALAICDGADARLCSPAEILNRCAANSGCKSNQSMMWGCIVALAECSEDAECCSGTCSDGMCVA